MCIYIYICRHVNVLFVCFTNHYQLIACCQQCINGNCNKYFIFASTFFQSIYDIANLGNNNAFYNEIVFLFKFDISTSPMNDIALFILFTIRFGK